MKELITAVLDENPKYILGKIKNEKNENCFWNYFHHP